MCVCVCVCGVCVCVCMCVCVYVCLYVCVYVCIHIVELCNELTKLKNKAMFASDWPTCSFTLHIHIHTGNNGVWIYYVYQ